MMCGGTTTPINLGTPQTLQVVVKIQTCPPRTCTLFTTSPMPQLPRMQHKFWLIAAHAQMSLPAQMPTHHAPLPRPAQTCTLSTTSPRPVQYAAPSEKNTDMSLPMSPDHCSNSALVAGRPVSSLAAYRVVAALPLPPPRPAPVGTAQIILHQMHCQQCHIEEHVALRTPGAQRCQQNPQQKPRPAPIGADHR